MSKSQLLLLVIEYI